MCQVVVVSQSHSGSALVSISSVSLRRSRLLLDGWPCPNSIPGAGHLSRNVAGHTGQLSLAIPLWVGTMSTSQRVVTPCGWGVGLVCGLQVKLCDPLVTLGPCERLIETV